MDTYANLKTAIGDWIKHDDAETDVDNLIDVFEAWANKHLRIYEAEAREAHTVPVGETHTYITLPDDWNGARTIRYDCEDTHYLTPELMDRQVYSDLTGEYCDRKFYTIENQTIRFHPPVPENIEIELLYWKKIDALSDSNTTNWLLDAHPDYYLFGSLYFGAIYIKAPEYVKLVSDVFADMRASIHGDSDEKLYGGDVLTVRIAR